MNSELHRNVEFIEFLYKQIESDIWSMRYYPTTHENRQSYKYRIKVVCDLLKMYQNDLNKFLNDYIEDVQKDSL